MNYTLEQVQEALMVYGMGYIIPGTKTFVGKKINIGAGKDGLHLYCGDDSTYIYCEHFFRDTNVKVFEFQKHPMLHQVAV